jgi:TonB-linked SusC/RagA family outer membrane protein
MKKSYDLLCIAQQRWKKTIRIMKLTVGLILFTMISASAVNSYSQTARISLNMNNATIVDIFREIERNSEFGFFFKSEELNLENRKSVKFTDATIDEVLKKVLDENCTYKILDKNIVVTRENLTTTQQGKKISGKITDKTGGSLPGVSVVIKGTTLGVITDGNGYYSLSNVPENAVLQYMFVGMKTQEMATGNKTIINIVLEEENIGIEEVIVVGYGTVKKSDITGALVSVSEKTIKERPVQNAVQAIQGKVAGVDIVSNVRPGEVASVTIRGTRSISASNSPLYVVDGIILMGSVNDINPNDINSMEILKDASATAIYGARGANGVVLITTKQGKKGRLSVNYDETTSFDNIHSTTDWASSGEAMDRMRLAEINGGTYKLGTTSLLYPDPQADINKFGNSDVMTIKAIRQGYEWNDPGTFASVKTRAATPAEVAKGMPAQVPVYNPGNIPTTDWQDILTRTGVTQNHLLSLSAGNETSRLYVSLGYYDNNGTQKNQGFTRYTAKINGDITPVKWLLVGASINASMSSQQYGTINRSGSATGPQDAYGMALGQYRMAQPYDDNGDMILYPGNNKSGPTWNPLIDIENSDDERRAMNIQANIFSEVKFTPWLKYRMNFGSGFRYQRNGAWQGSQSTLRRTATPQTAAASYATNDNFQYMLENLLYFDKTFDKHTFGATLLQSIQKSRTESSNIGTSKIIYDSSKWYNLAANLNGNPDSYGTGFSENSLMSYMVRLNYTLMNKYLFTATGRNDGASVLAAGHKWSFFPSFAVAWKMHEEGFLKPITWINELKLRVGYGVVGNSAVGAFSTSGPLTQYKYAFGDIAAIGYNPYNMPNPEMKWETTAQTNLGIDFSFLKSRITGTVELYRSNTDNILMDRSIPAIVGYPFITGNIGKMMNQGIEFSISTVNVQSRKVKWSTDFNWSANHEEIVELVNGKEDMKGNNWFIGQPLQVFRTYEVDGLWQNTAEDLAAIALWKANGYNFAPGQYKPIEQGTPNYKLEDNDKVIRGTVRPKWVAGMTNTLNYNNFELSAMLYARIGQKYFSSLQPGGSGGGSYVGYVRSVDPSEFWSTDNAGGKWPMPTTDPKASNADVNRAMFINNGSFVSLRSIALSYNVPSKILDKYKVKSFQIYGQILNPLIFGGDVVKAGINPDDTNGWTNVNSVGDPTGGSNNNTMVIKSYVLGVRIGL